MNRSSSKNQGQFMFSFGLCGILAGVGLIVFGTWQGIFGLISGGLVAVFGFKQIKEAKNT